MSLAELMKPLRRGLASLRSRARSLLVLLGISRVVVLLVILLVGYFLADYFMRLPLDVRRILAVLLAGGLGYTLFLHVLKPLAAPLSDQMLASRVEAESDTRPEGFLNPARQGDPIRYTSEDALE